jgi:hypothetical protein
MPRNLQNVFRTDKGCHQHGLTFPTPVTKMQALQRALCRYFKGLASWQFWSGPGNIVRGRNRAGQRYDHIEGTVENYAEIAGDKIHVRAFGEFHLQVRM